MTRDTTNPKIKAFVSKYALTKGIFEVEAEHCVDINPDMIAIRDRWNTCYHKGQWHQTREAAEQKAEEMRKRKIASLKKQIANLEKLDFSG